jgi:CBS domain-containing membrane protein
MSRYYDLLLAPLGEGALILVLAAIGWATRWPFVFASLGPTAYEIVEKPASKSARPYNIIAGHFVGLGAGWFALWALNAWGSPKVSVAGAVAAPRVWAALIAVVLTTGGTLAIRAGQPASLSTSLLVSLGSMQTARDAVAIIISVLMIAAIGEPLRRQRAKMAQTQGLAKDLPSPGGPDTQP